MQYKIYPLQLSQRTIDGSGIILRYPHGKETYQLVIGAFVLKDAEGNCILFDSGPPSKAEILANGYGFNTPDDSVEYIDEIKKLGVVPEQVKTIVLSHLHWDHSWNLQHFPNAAIYIQEKEIEHAIHPLKNSLKSYGMLKPCMGHNWLIAAPQFITVRGEAEILPGLCLIPTPGHTPGSQSALVNTAEGQFLLCADFAFNGVNIQRELPVASINSVSDWYDSLARVKPLLAAGCILLPTHDEATYRKKVYG